MNIIFITQAINPIIHIKLFLYKYYNILCLLLNVYQVIELIFMSLLFTFYINIRCSLTSQDLPFSTLPHLSNTIMIK